MVVIDCISFSRNLWVVAWLVLIDCSWNVAGIVFIVFLVGRITKVESQAMIVVSGYMSFSMKEFYKERVRR